MSKDKSIENIDVDNLLHINPDELEEDIKSCPSWHYFFGELAVTAEELYNRAVLELETHELKLSQKFKAEFAESQKGSKFKPETLGETEIKRMFRGDEEWRNLKDKELKLYSKYKTMRVATDSFNMKSLSCMALNKRQLFKAGKGFEDI